MEHEEWPDGGEHGPDGYEHAYEPHLDGTWDAHDDPHAHHEEPDTTDLGAHHDLTDEVPYGDDDGGPSDVFPPALDFETPEPVDGFPWTDPTSLGGTGGYEPAMETPPVSELLAYDGVDATDADPWTTLENSEDPATSSLARWWRPDN
ncbi:hypothetical protein Lfu02_07570 [Longispora fulva]|uniref:Uncharacterized protein n=1 Tax=Longispora fulva TaxID=619741 RepID=A0A8J7GP92_9ACTN|nr:hypothetical protein [Longispora fulva]MBG6135373.1 hypothetical protein [Longispora fulva]GIG56385.1 hypothetical protein Lfu02_07570 [Longispora fulva]